jgi:hypothetical protein
MKRAKQEWSTFLDNLRVIYFAVGCNVFSEQYAQPFITERFAYFTSRPWIQWYRKALDEAAQQGLAKAKIPNACSFWRDFWMERLPLRSLRLVHDDLESEAKRLNSVNPPEIRIPVPIANQTRTY